MKPIASSTPVFVLIVLFGLGFADRASADELQRRGMIGVQLGPLPDAEDLAEDMPEQGVVINGVVPGGSAEKAGLKANDIIVKIGADNVKDPAALTRIMRKYRADDDVPFTVHRGGQLVTKTVKLLARPRETSEEFEVIYGSVPLKDQRLRSIITRPKGQGPLPAILFLPSPTPQSVEIPPQLADHPYRQTLDRLTKAGVVTMRVDRLGVGDSDGDDPYKTDLKTDVAGLASAVKTLAAYDFVNPREIYVLSMGMGSCLAPLVAQEAPVAGVALYASTVVRPWSQSLTEGMARGWRLNGEKQRDIEERAKMLAEYIRQVEKPGVDPAAALEKFPKLKEALEADGPGGPESILGIPAIYFRDIAATDYSRLWPRVSVPVLSLYGQADYQANEADCKLIADLVNKAHAGRATYQSIPKVDHVCQQAADQEASLASGYQGEFNPVVLETVLAWIKEQSRPAKT